MNLNKIRVKKETEGLLLTITKNWETLIELTHRKAEETLEFKKIKPSETFRFNPPIQTEGDWMIGLTGLEVYNSIFNVTEENNKFKVCKFPDEKSGGVSYIKVRDEIEKDLDISDNTASDLEDDIIGPNIIEECRNQVTKRMKDDKYMDILGFYVCSVFQVFESYLRTEVQLVEDDNKMVLLEYNSSFITYELKQGFYTFKYFFEALLKILKPEYDGYHNASDIEYDEIAMKTKLDVRAGFIAIRFDEQSFFRTILGFTPHWDYKQYKNYISHRIVNLSSTNKIHLKCDCIDGSVVDGLRQPILYSFVLDKSTGYKVFCKTETVHYKK